MHLSWQRQEKNPGNSQKRSWNILTFSNSRQMFVRGLLVTQYFFMRLFSSNIETEKLSQWCVLSGCQTFFPGMYIYKLISQWVNLTQINTPGSYNLTIPWSFYLFTDIVVSQYRKITNQNRLPPRFTLLQITNLTTQWNTFTKITDIITKVK